MLEKLDLTDNDYHLIILGGLTMMLYMTSLVRTVSMIFILNFSSGGLNASIILFFFSLSGFIYAITADRYYPHSNKFLYSSFGTGLLSLLLSMLPLPIISLVFAVAFQISSTPTLISVLMLLRKKFALAGAFSILVNALVLSMINYSSFYGSGYGLFLLGLLGLVWAGFGGYLVRIKDLFHQDEVQISSTSALMGFLVFNALLLAYPNVLATWLLVNDFLVLLIMLLGVALGIAMLVYFPFEFRYQEYIMLGVYLLSLVLLIWVQIPFFYLLSILLIEFASIMLLSSATRDNATASMRTLGIKMGLIQLLAMLLLFLQISTPFWTGMPAFLHGILRNNGQFLAFLLGLILPVSAGLSIYWRR